MVRVGSLGPLEVRDGDRPLDVAGARLRALLIRLALDPGRPVSVPALAEALWRMDHAPGDPKAASQSGSRAAEVRFLPEGSPLPYGKGVFLRPRGALVLRWQAQLVFAGRCGAMATRWVAPDRLRIHCELLEGEPWLPRTHVDGTEIEVVLQRKRAVAALPALRS